MEHPTPMPTPDSSPPPANWTAPTADELRGAVPGYEIRHLLGCGGMAAVYEARQVSLERSVAVKILPPALGNDPNFTAMFEAEARALGRLNHPGVVTVIDCGRTQSGWWFIAMELVDGLPLGAWSRSRTPAEKKRTVKKLLEAVAACHEAGIVHSDLKPANVLVQADGSVKVMDFGLAGVVGTPADLQGPRFGTPPYTAPEAYSADARADARSDVFSLGRVLLEVFDDATTPEADPAAGLRRLEPRLSQVISAMLEADPAARPASVRACLAQLESSAPVPRRPTAARKTSRPVKKSSSAGLGALVAAAVAVALGYAVLHRRPPVAPGEAESHRSQAVVESPTPPATATSDEASAIFSSDGEKPEAAQTESPAPMANTVLPAVTEPPVTTTPPEAPGTHATAATTSASAPKPALAAVGDPSVRDLFDKLVAAVQKRLDGATTNRERALFAEELERLRSEPTVPYLTPAGTPETLGSLWAVYREEVAKRRLQAATTGEAPAPSPATPPGMITVFLPPEPDEVAGPEKLRLQVFWAATQEAKLSLNGKRIEPIQVEEGAESVNTIYRAEMEVEAGDVVGFRLKSDRNSHREFMAVGKVGSRLLFYTDNRWQVMDGEAPESWLSKPEGDGREPRRVSTKERNDAAIRRFCTVTGASPGSLLPCWCEDPRRVAIRRIITAVDVRTALGR